MANQVIFSGAPSQICNLPAILKGCAVMAVIGGIHLCASNAFPLQWQVLLAQAGAVSIGVALPFVKTAFTRIVINTEQITWSQGVFNRRVFRLNLSRIQSVTAIYPWWMRLFGVGSIMLATDDLAHPVRRLPGIRNADQLRRKLDEAVALQRKQARATNTYDPHDPDHAQVHSV
jgi:uncharacterized membrane protein YdbT with pleckstrin-like domain